MKRLTFGFFILSAAATAQPGPEDAVRGLIRAFDDHAVIMVGEAHWLAQARDLYINLVRDPLFQAKVNDIVIEFAGRQNQPLLDRYIAGAPVPYDELAHLWRDTTKVASWESPVYEEWLAAIRDVNHKLPPARRLRVLAGDTAIDWSKMRTHDEWAALGDNNISFAQLINQQVEQRRKVFVVLGGNHVTKNGDRNHDPDTLTRVERRHPGSTYVALLYDLPEMDGWRVPSLLSLRHSSLAASKTARGDRLDQVADALLYLGPRRSYSTVKPPLSSVDAAYLNELERRSNIEWGHGLQREIFFQLDPAWKDHAASARITGLKDQRDIDRLWQETKGAPLVETIPEDPEHRLVTFLHRGTPQTSGVSLSAQLSTTREDPPMSRLAGTDLWHRTFWMRSDLRLSYAFTDNSASEAPGDRLPLELSDAPPQPWNGARTGVPAGTMSKEEIDSRILRIRREAWVYTPPGYDRRRAKPYPVAVIFDGPLYNSPELPGARILDNLIAAGKIESIIAVLVGQLPQPGRNLELGNNAPFADYVATELIPYLRSKYRLSSDPAQRALCGSSAGGLGSAYIAYRHPEAFGNVLSQSGAFWPGRTREDPDHEWVIKQYESSPKLPIRFVLQAGVLEIVNTPLNGPPILQSNRHLRDVLRAKGYEVFYRETAGGHEALNWRGGFAEGLIQLFGR